MADPLAEATSLVAQLKEHSPDRLATHLWAAEVYVRRGRPLLALAAVQRAIKIGGAGDAGAHRAAVRWCQYVAAHPPQQAEVKKVGACLAEVAGVMRCAG